RSIHLSVARVTFALFKAQGYAVPVQPMDGPSRFIETSIDAYDFFRADDAMEKLFSLQQRCRSLFDDGENRLHYAIVECIHSYQSLFLILNRFGQEQSMYYAELDAVLLKDTPILTGPRTMKPKEQVHRARLTVLSSLIRLDIESFYTVAKQLLDRSVDLFKFL